MGCISAASLSRSRCGIGTRTVSGADGTTPAGPINVGLPDFTYSWTTRDGFCLPPFIVDAYSRMNLGWGTATVMDTRMVLMALEHALFSCKRMKMQFTST